jgi:hypothetical protein
MPIDTIAPLITDIGALDWDNLAAVTATTDKLLTALDSDRAVLRELAERAIDDPHLLRLCEHYDILDKIVLHNDPSGWRLRLSYIHTLYGTEDQLGNGDIDVAAFQPKMVRTESTSNFYTLHHTMIHSVTARPHTTSLIVRGPAVKDRFLVTDRTTGQAWWRHGAATESPDEAARKRMSAAQANACLEKLTELGVLRAVRSQLPAPSRRAG